MMMKYLYIYTYIPCVPEKKSLFSSRNALRFSQFFCALAVVDENIVEFIIIRSCRNKHENKMQIANFAEAQVIIHVGYKLSFYRFS